MIINIMLGSRLSCIATAHIPVVKFFFCLFVLFDDAIIQLQ